jgi:hypothetical protein
LQVTDLFFCSLFAFFVMELKSRKVIHINVTRAPTDLLPTANAVGMRSGAPAAHDVSKWRETRLKFAFTNYAAQGRSLAIVIS